MDSSYSTDTEAFNAQKNFIKRYLSKVTTSLVKFHICIIQYSDEAIIEIPFGVNMTKQSMMDTVESMTMLNRTTNIGKALTKAKQTLSGSHSTSMMVYLLTDGLPSDPKEFQIEVKSLRNYLSWINSRNRFFMVAFGNSVRHKTFVDATKDSPWKTNDIFHTTNLDSLYEIVPSLVDARCEGKHFTKDKKIYKGTELPYL